MSETLKRSRSASSGTRKGFSLIEVLVYTAIIGVVGTLLNGILIGLLRLQNSQIAATEVHQQINFVILTIQRLVRQSESINMTVNDPSSTLTLHMADAAKDPTLIYRDASVIYMKEGSGNPIPLIIEDVNATHLEFTKISSAAGHDAAQFTISLEYNTENPQREYAKTITSVVAHPAPEN